MGKIISVANQKGGVGKTTTTINLAAALGEEGKKVLVIDMDPQGNTTSGIGIDKNNVENTVYELILGECTIKESILKDVIKNVSLIPANVNFAAAEVELIGIEKQEYILKNEIEWITDQYDYILIDCPPSLSTLTVNALTASDSVLVPIQCEYYALEGLSQLIHTVNLIKQRLNSKIGIEGVVFTMYDSRTNLSAQVVENVKENFAYNVFETVIPRNTRVAEAPSYGMPVIQYDPKANGSEAYRSLAREVIANNK
jgi:chromosome partitioning protein